MNPGYRILALTLLASLFVAVPAAAIAIRIDGDIVATEEDSTDEAPNVDDGTGVVPAVEAPPVAPEEEEQPWTARFLAPAVLALGVGAFAATAVYYGVRIRRRYEVID